MIGNKSGGGRQGLDIALDHMEITSIEDGFSELILFRCSAEISQLTLRHDLPFPVVTKRKYPCLFMVWELKQTKPMGYPIGGDPVPFCKLLPGQVVTDQFIVKLHGNDQGVAVLRFFRTFFGNIWAGRGKVVYCTCSGSRNFQFGVPDGIEFLKVATGDRSKTVPCCTEVLGSVQYASVMYIVTHQQVMQSCKLT